MTIGRNGQSAGDVVLHVLNEIAELRRETQAYTKETRVFIRDTEAFIRETREFMDDTRTFARATALQGRRSDGHLKRLGILIAEMADRTRLRFEDVERRLAVLEGK